MENTIVDANIEHGVFYGDNYHSDIEDAIEEMLEFNEVYEIDELADDFTVEFNEAVPKPCFKFSEKWINFMVDECICDEIHGILDDIDGEERLKRGIKAAIIKHTDIEAINNEIPKIFYQGKEFTMNKNSIKRIYE